RFFQWILGFQTPTSTYGEPRQKPKLLLLTIGQSLFGFAVLDVVSVLDADDGNNFARPFDFIDADVRYSYVTNLACVLHFLQRPDRSLQWHFVIHTVQLIQINAVQS